MPRHSRYKYSLSRPPLFGILLLQALWNGSGLISLLAGGHNVQGLPLVQVLAVATATAAPTEHTESPHDDIASHYFKAPNADTPDDIREHWRQQDNLLWAYVREQVPAVLNHTGAAAFDEHLRGVQAVLRYWQAPEFLTKAGLFHSIYGTEGFQGFALPLSYRSDIQLLIGRQAEKLCWVFCMVDRSTVDDTVFAYFERDAPPTEHSSVAFTARPELGRFPVILSNRQEWLDFIELTLADWLEQVQGAASTPSSLFLWEKGEAYSHRRHAFSKMADLLTIERNNSRYRDMYEAVMGTESPHTRQLVQPRTPPMSEAAAAALEALRAAGEDIPDYLGPVVTSEGKEETRRMQGGDDEF